MKKSKAEKWMDNEIERVWRKLACGVQINIMDIPAVFRDAKAEFAKGISVEAAMPAIIERYKVAVSP